MSPTSSISQDDADATHTEGQDVVIANPMYQDPVCLSMALPFVNVNYLNIFLL